MGLCLPTASPLPLPSLVILYWAAGNTCPTWPALSRTEQKASSHLASLGEETGWEQDSHWSRGWSPGCCFHFGFLLPVRPGIFNDSEMKLLHRCEMTASCRRQTNYLQTQPTTPTQPHKGSQPASLG